MYRITTLLFLLLVCNLTAQDSNSIDVYFSTDPVEINEISLKDMNIFIEENLVDINDPQICVNVFPSTQKEQAQDVIELLNELLLEYGLKLNRSLHFRSDEHLNFDPKAIQNWNFIRLTYEDKIRSFQALETPIKSRESFNNLEQVHIESKHAVSLTLEKGTLVDISANSFVDKNGIQYTGKVNLVTEEILDIEDAILSNVTTNLESGFLESKGMVVINALDLNGNELFLADGKTITISIPTNDQLIESDFKIYRGELNDEKYDWVLDDAKPELVEKPCKIRYVWRPLSEELRTDIEAQRNDLIQEHKDRGVGYNTMRKRMRKYKDAYDKKKRKEKEARFSKYERNYDKLNKRMILGDAKYNWEKDTTYIPQVRRYRRFTSSSLGMLNIDKIFDLRSFRTKDLFVKNSEQLEIKLFFKERLVLLSGDQLNNKTQFKDLPVNKEMVLISTKKIDEETIEMGYAIIISGSKNYEIDNKKQFTVPQYKDEIRKLTR